MPPVAKFYYGKTSFYSAIARLTIAEKGYGDDEIDWKEVDLASGANYQPEFVRINPFATVPALVAPLEKTLHDDEVKYKALTDSRPIVEFLDKSRSARSRTHTTSDAPAPVLTPATVSHLNASNRIIDTVNKYPVAHYMISAQTDEQLIAFSKTGFASVLRARLSGITRALSNVADYGIPAKVIPTLEARKAFFSSVVLAMDGVVVDKPSRTPEQQAAIEEYFKRSENVWKESLPKQLAVFEEEVVGPLSLGDQVSLSDMYLTAWVTRLVAYHGGDGTPEAVGKIPGSGPKLKAFWEAIIQRPSWQKVYGEKLY